jgi:hypothetical protein
VLGEDAVSDRHPIEDHFIVTATTLDEIARVITLAFGTSQAN